MNAFVDRTAARPPRVLGLLVLLAATLPHLWVVGLRFQLDDYAMIPFAGSELFFEPPPALPGATRPPAEVDAIKADPEAHGRYLFRPALWLASYGLKTACGGTAKPAPFHLAALLWHGAAAWLLYRLLCGFVAAAPAAVGAIAFAVCPGAIQAVSWISANGDVMALVFTLLGTLAVRATRRRASLAAEAVAAAAFALAFLSKETMIATLPGVALVALATKPDADRRPGPWPRILATCAAAALLAYWARHAVLQTWSLRYAFHRDLGVVGALKLAPALVGQLFAPWNRDPRFSEPYLARGVAHLVGATPIASTRLFACAAAALPSIAGSIADPRRTPLRVAAALVVGAIALAPSALYVFTDDGTFSWNRTFYPATPAFGAAVAFGVAPLWAARRGLAIAVLVPLAAVAADFEAHVRRCERYAAAAIDGRLESLRGLAEAAPAGTRFIAVDPEIGLGGIPLVRHFDWAMSATFTEKPVKMTWAFGPEEARRHAIVASEPGAVQFLKLESDRFVADGPALAALPATPPALVRDASDPALFRLSEPATTRAVAAIRFAATPTADVRGCTWTRSNGEARRTGFGAPPSGVDYYAAAPEGLDWWAGPPLASVRISGAAPSATPAILRELPEVELVAPEPGAVVVLGDLPNIAFRSPLSSGEFRVLFEFNIGGALVPIACKTRRDRLRAEGGALVFTPGPDDDVTWEGSPYRVRWEGVADFFRKEFRPKGISRLNVDYRVEGLAPDGENAESRSPWRRLALADRGG